MGQPRLMIAATSSGSGKTLVTCGILQALVNRGLKVASFKCGPDYIDPMFHSHILGNKAINLDTFFTEENITKYLFARRAKDAQISIIEGVMGYYDGLAGISLKASSYDLAKTIESPVILVVNAKGASMSVIPIIKGFIEYKSDSRIQGIIINQISKGLYLDIKNKIESELNIKVYGYLPKVQDLVIESRHLGLVTPNEIECLNDKLNKLANLVEETIELDELLTIANTTSTISYSEPHIKKVEGNPQIAIAMDEAFCFYYEDNIQLLKDMGAKIVYFSPLKDKAIPKNCDGLILGGGYPELYAKQLYENVSMKKSIFNAINIGLPCLAECGGFMYLHKEMEDIEGVLYEMSGVIEAKAYKTNSLNRFGYITLTSNNNNIMAKPGDSIAGHEFHYFESTMCGESFLAKKPLRKSNWNCLISNENILVGYPHLYYYSNTDMVNAFLNRCIKKEVER